MRRVRNSWYLWDDAKGAVKRVVSFHAIFFLTVFYCMRFLIIVFIWGYEYADDLFNIT